LPNNTYKLKEMGNGHNMVSSSEYLLPKNDVQFVSEPINSAVSQNALSSSSLASSSLSPPTSQSNNISQNNSTNYIQSYELSGIPDKGMQGGMSAFQGESNMPKDNSIKGNKATVLTRENVNDHNHLNSKYTQNRPSEGKALYSYNKERLTNTKLSNGNRDTTITENSELDLDQTTMIGSALDLDSLSGEEDQNSKHINNAQDPNNCDESSFVTTKASSLSDQCKTAGISTIYQDNDRRKSAKVHSSRNSGISGTGKMYYQPSNQNNFDPSAV